MFTTLWKWVTKSNMFLLLIYGLFYRYIGIGSTNCNSCRSRWQCCLRRRSEAAWLLQSRVRIPLRSRMFVSYLCCVFCTHRSLWRTELFPKIRTECMCLCRIECDPHTSGRGVLEPRWADAPQKKLISLSLLYLSTDNYTVYRIIFSDTFPYL